MRHVFSASVMPAPLTLRQPLGAALAVGLLSFSPQAFSAESSGGYTFVSMLMLALLVAAVAVLAWLMRRGAAGGGAGASMRLLAAQPLGSRERVVVIKVGERFFLLGHTPSQISMLAELAPDDVPQQSNRLPPNLFAELLTKMKK